MKLGVIIFALLLTMSALAWAQDFGMGLDAGFSYYGQTKSGWTSTETSFSAAASFVIRFSGLVELTPFARFTLLDDRIPLTDSRLDAGAGAGLYFHLLQGDVIELSIGPKLLFEMMFDLEEEHSDYSDFSIYLYLPIILDIKLIKNVLLRITAELIYARFRVMYQNPGDLNEYYVFFDVHTCGESLILDYLRLGLVFMF